MPDRGLCSVAFAPGHITGFFQVHDHRDPRKKGSTGCGFVLDRGVRTEVSLSSGDRTEILLNGTLVDGRTTRTLVELLTDIPLKVDCISQIPIGCGFGASAAGALSTAYAINRALSLDLTTNQLIEAAHTAEVQSGSGLGDVMAQSHGGVVIRRSAGCHPYGLLDRIPCPAFEIDCVVLGELFTDNLLSNTDISADSDKSSSSIDLINRTGQKCLKELLLRPTLERFMQLSQEFTFEAGFLSSRAEDIIEAVLSEGAFAAQAMLGDAVFTYSPFRALREEVMEILSGSGEVQTYTVTPCFFNL